MADEILNEENRKAMDAAFEECQKAEKAMYRAFVERLPSEQTIILWAKKREDYHKLAQQFLKDILDSPSTRAEPAPLLASRETKWITRLVVYGTGLVVAYFLLFLIRESLWGKEPLSKNWLVRLAQIHYPALIGTPLSAMAAFCIVSALKVTSGPIEFQAWGLKFRGATGPILLWIFCFGSVVAAFYWLWSCSQ